jgi:hypothetical protein
MKHFTIQLSDSARQTRQWSIWADTLTVGSDPRCSIVLPVPAAPQVGAFCQDAVLDLPFGHLDVREDTPRRLALWSVARDRIGRSRLLDWQEPGERQRKARTLILSGIGVLCVAFSCTMVRIGRVPFAQSSDPNLEPILTLVIPPEKTDPPPVPVAKDAEPNPATSDKPQSGPVGGSAEDRTQAFKDPQNPARVMDGSVMARLNEDLDGLIGEPMDDQKPSEMDVIVAGQGGTHLVKGNRGGHMSGGDGDRLAEVGGSGLGHGGRSGFGDGRGSAAGDKMRIGTTAGHAGTALRAPVRVSPPTDVDIGGDAGSRSSESILRVIRQHMGGFRYVYEKYLRDNPDLGGKISLRFTIAPSGEILQIAVMASNTGNEEMDQNIKEQAKKMRFDEIPKGNVTVSYAFVLDRQ